MNDITSLNKIILHRYLVSFILANHLKYWKCIAELQGDGHKSDSQSSMMQHENPQANHNVLDINSLKKIHPVY